MKGLILAAGLGRRLRPYTRIIPKPLIPLANRALINYNLDLMKAAGIKEVIINLHHLSGKIHDFFSRHPYPGLVVSFSREPEILGTGGGIKQVEWFMDGDGLAVINSDILTCFPLAEMIDYHKKNQALATLALSSGQEISRYGGVETDGGNVIRRFPHMTDRSDLEKVKGNKRFKKGVFLGIQIIGPELMGRLPAKTFSCVVKDCYSRNLSQGGIIGFWDKETYWRDLGTPGSYLEAQMDLFSQEGLARAAGLDRKGFKLPPDLETDRSVKLIPPVVIGPGCRIGSGCRIGPMVSIGENAVLESGVKISSSIVWPQSRLAAGSVIEHHIITPNPGQVDHVG